MDSVLQQTYRPIEIIIVDDGSDDGSTPEVLAALSRAYPDITKVVSQTNQGPGVAREYGRQMAQGEYIQYLDSDDVLLPDKFHHQIGLLERHMDCGMALGLSRIRKADGRVLEEGRTDLPERASLFPTLLNSRWWGTSTPLYRRVTTDQAGPWPPDRLYEDWQYEAQVAALGQPYCQLPEYVVEIRHHTGERLFHRKDEDRHEWLLAFSKAHLSLHGLARRTGVTAREPEMQRFVHQLIRLAEDCSRFGLKSRAKQLLRTAIPDALSGGHPGVLLEIGRSVLGLWAWGRRS